mmetsp:Transcript_27038/g.68771  ORF Transcript_27038/g.68771 Transcript_27038/m.68771 type:complete len:203 (-) Transcript_27038:1027-1635(-)
MEDCVVCATSCPCCACSRTPGQPAGKRPSGGSANAVDSGRVARVHAACREGASPPHVYPSLHPVSRTTKGHRCQHARRAHVPFLGWSSSLGLLKVQPRQREVGRPVARCALAVVRAALVASCAGTATSHPGAAARAGVLRASIVLSRIGHASKGTQLVLAKCAAAGEGGRGEGDVATRAGTRGVGVRAVPPLDLGRQSPSPR